MTREDVDDDEVVEDIAGDIDERECSMGLEESTVSVAGSTTTSSSILPDSGLIAEQKLLAYNDVTWRLRVRQCSISSIISLCDKHIHSLFEN